MNRKLMPLEAFALIAFFATMPVYSPNVVPLQECLQDNEIMGHFVTRRCLFLWQAHPPYCSPTRPQAQPALKEPSCCIRRPPLLSTLHA